MLAIILVLFIGIWLFSRLYLLLNWLIIGVSKPYKKEYQFNSDELINMSDYEIIEPIPYYINDEIDAIYNQLETHNKLIDYYTNELQYINNPEKRLKQEKRISDLKYKCSKLENKVNKLLDKYEK